jgi:hypothetical protein
MRDPGRGHAAANLRAWPETSHLEPAAAESADGRCAADNTARNHDAACRFIDRPARDDHGDAACDDRHTRYHHCDAWRHHRDPGDYDRHARHDDLDPERDHRNTGCHHGDARHDDGHTGRHDGNARGNHTRRRDRGAWIGRGHGRRGERLGQALGRQRRTRPLTAAK